MVAMTIARNASPRPAELRRRAIEAAVTTITGQETSSSSMYRIISIPPDPCGRPPRSPLVTLKVTAGIHWEALKLWIKRVPLFRKPPPPESILTVGK